MLGANTGTRSRRKTLRLELGGTSNTGAHAAGWRNQRYQSEITHQLNRWVFFIYSYMMQTEDFTPELLRSVGSTQLETPLQKVLKKVPQTTQLMVRDLRTGVRRFDPNPARTPIDILQLASILLAVKKKQLSTDDFELWSYQDGVYDINKNGWSEKLSKWDYLVTLDEIMSKLNKSR